MRNKLLIWSVVYFIGIILLVVSGMQVMNWITYLSVVIGVAGYGYALLAKDGVV